MRLIPSSSTQSSDIHILLAGSDKSSWGRRSHASSQRGIIAAAFMTFCALLVAMPWIAIKHFNSSLTMTIEELCRQGPWSFISSYYPRFSADVFFVYFCWVIFQGALYTFLPGPVCEGQTTPSGKVLEYRTNGITAFVVSVALGIAGAAARIIDPAIIAKHWGSLIVTWNLYGLLLSLVFYIKANLWPTHAQDRKFSGMS